MCPRPGAVRLQSKQRSPSVASGLVPDVTCQTPIDPAQTHLPSYWPRTERPQRVMLRGRIRAWLVLGMALSVCSACSKGVSELRGWRALQPGVEMRLEPRAGPAGQAALALLYTIAPGKDYVIECSLPVAGLSGRPELRLQARTTRVLHIALVLVDQAGQEHECVQTLLPDGWHELQFVGFLPDVGDWASVQAMRLVDRTGGLGGQGPVSLKLAGLPLQ